MRNTTTRTVAYIDCIKAEKTAQIRCFSLFFQLEFLAGDERIELPPKVLEAHGGVSAIPVFMRFSAPLLKFAQLFAQL